MTNSEVGRAASTLSRWSSRVKSTSTLKARARAEARAICRCLMTSEADGGAARWRSREHLPHLGHNYQIKTAGRWRRGGRASPGGVQRARNEGSSGDETRFKPPRLALSFSPEAKLSSADRWHHLPRKSVYSHFCYNFQPFLEQRLSEMFSRYYDNQVSEDERREVRLKYSDEWLFKSCNM